ncbi:PA2778 family cysteine peptidase [Ruegeria jejuensis]|uniref:PA2778 family cysteine peptidase n=1 Tax=Ruegeria jejuensis TaxID=3233338 RepID=UPI00355BFDA7
MADVPIIKQNAFHCGPASLAMVLQWSGRDVTQAEIASLAFTPKANGTYLADMIGAARRRGQLVVQLSTFPELLEEVAAGHPVIVFQNLGLSWSPRWHYAVVVGYDLDSEKLVLHSGEHDRMTMDSRLFQRTWRRGEFWAITVLPPNLLPETGNEWEVLRAAAALEQQGHDSAAAKVYKNGSRRWPDNWIWPYGLGNARYKLGDLEGAKVAFEHAAKVDPTAPEIQHNLTQVKKELGEYAE